MNIKEVRALFKRIEKGFRKQGRIDADPLFVVKHESGMESIIPQAREIMGLPGDDFLIGGLSSKQTALTEMLLTAYKEAGPVSSVIFVAIGCKGIVPEDSEPTHVLVNEQSINSSRSWYGKIKLGKKISIGEPEFTDKPDDGFVPKVIDQVLKALLLQEKESATIN